MKILHLVESLDRGGLERVVVELARTQRARGETVAVCCLFHRGTLADELDADGIAVHVIGKRPGLDIRAVLRLRALMQTLRLNVLHTHNATANYYGVLAALGREVRIINTRHGMGAARGGRTEQLFRVSLIGTDAVVLVCEAARAHFVRTRAVPERLAHVVPNGIELKRFNTSRSPQSAPVRADLPAMPTIGTVGRLNWAKDHALMLRSFALLQREGAMARLVIAGDGELRAELEALTAELGIAEQVTFLGDRSDVPDLLATFDMFLMTSATEGYSLALLEAAATGIPIVASDVGGNREIVQDGTTGFVVQTRTPEAFADRLRELLVNASLCRKMGREARDWAFRHAGLEAMAESYGLLYSRQSRPSAVVA